MITGFLYEHDCPDDCPLNGETGRVTVFPTIMGGYYLHPDPRCVYTSAPLKLAEVKR